MDVMNKAALSLEELHALEERLGGQTTLERVLRWGVAQSPRRSVEEIITQDEYTHDVLIPWEEGRYLVYGVT